MMLQELLPIDDPETHARARMLGYACHVGREPAPLALAGRTSFQLARSLDLVAPAALYTGGAITSWVRHRAALGHLRDEHATRLWDDLPARVRALSLLEVSGLVVAGLLRLFEVQHPELGRAVRGPEYSQEPGRIVRIMGTALPSAARSAAHAARTVRR